MLSNRLGTVDDFIGGLNQFWAIANLTLSQHLLEKKKKTKDAFTLSTQVT